MKFFSISLSILTFGARVLGLGGHDTEPSLMKRVGCIPGLVACTDQGICCPGGTYCTTDAVGRSACCSDGAVCTGIITPANSVLLPIPTTSVPLSQPISEAASLHRYPSVFGVIAQLGRICSARAFSKKDAIEGVDNLNASSNSTGTCGTPIELKFAGPMLYENRGGKGKNCTAKCDNITSAATVLRPLSLFAVSSYLVSHIKAAILPTQNVIGNPSPELKFVGANIGILDDLHGRNQTNHATGSDR